MRRFLTLLVMVFPTCALAQMPSPSTWSNTRGSFLNVLIADPVSGAFTGTYINNAAGFDCRGAPYATAGTSQGPRVTFTVDWKGFLVPNCHSKTVWQGRLLGTTLKTSWRLDYIGNDGQPHTMRGVDVFTRQ